MGIIEIIKEEGLVLVPAIYVLGMMLKGANFVADKYIPLLLLPLGVLGSLALQGFSAAALVQGVLITGLCVYGNQVGKQLSKEE